MANTNQQNIDQAYGLARERFEAFGVQTEAAMERLATIPISMHCWQGDDVGGFETVGAELTGGGIQATGNYPGKARTIDELRSDAEKAYAMIPGKHRFNLHACYIDNGGTYVDRNEIEPKHFQSWIDWAKANGLGMDFNPTYFSHDKAADGFTLSHIDKGIRDFWIEHGIACRKIGAEMGKQLGTPTVTNVWIPDGFKDIPVDRYAPRQRLTDSLDKLFAEEIPGPGGAPGRDRVEAVRHRGGELHGGLARVLHGLRRLAAEAVLPGRGALPPDGDDLRQDLRRCWSSSPNCCCT